MKKERIKSNELREKIRKGLDLTFKKLLEHKRQTNGIIVLFEKGKIKNRPQKEFEYFDKGSLATVGRNLAVVDIPNPKLHFRGFFAWLIWMGLHLVLLLGVKNRFAVFSNWVYNYITYDQNLRLIFKEFYRPPKIR